MSPELASLLVAVERAAKELPSEEIPALLGDLRRIEAVAEGRMISTLAQMSGRAEAQTTEDRLLTIPEVAALVAVPTARVYEMIRQGQIPAVRVGEKSLRIPRAALRDWIGQHQEKGVDRPGYSVYSPSNTRGRGDRLTAPKAAPTAGAPPAGAGRAPRRRAQHRGAVGAGRGADPRGDGAIHPAPGEDRAGDEQ